MPVPDCPSNLVQGHFVFIVDSGDIFRFRDGIPILGAVYMLETNVLPYVLPFALDDGKHFEFLTLG